MHMCTQTPEENIGGPPVSRHYLTGPGACRIGVGQLASKPQPSSCLYIPSPTVLVLQAQTALPGFLGGCWGFELKPLYFFRKEGKKVLIH